MCTEILWWITVSYLWKWYLEICTDREWIHLRCRTTQSLYLYTEVLVSHRIFHEPVRSVNLCSELKGNLSHPFLILIIIIVIIILLDQQKHWKVQKLSIVFRLPHLEARNLYGNIRRTVRRCLRNVLSSIFKLHTTHFAAFNGFALNCYTLM